MFMLEFTIPPLPHFIACDYERLPVGSRHVSRRNTGVFDLLFVRSGCIYISEEGRDYEVSSGDCLILAPDRYHYSTAECREDTFYFWLHFQTTGLWTLQEQLPEHRPEHNVSDLPVFLPTMTITPFTQLIPQYVSLPQPGKFGEVLEELTLLGKSLHLPGSRFKQQLLFQEVLRQLADFAASEAPSAQMICAERAAAYLREHYREEVTAKALGESINFHPVYIARCMQKAFGCSPAAYLVRYRVERSKLLLMQTDLSIARIAEEVGFNQSAYFTSCFVKYEGVSPRKYRKRFAY
ncbi:AraC family transcriptional regulator [Paenibacillus yonginensis]|uniref:AraC family transcriptional regulator n=1 Tax=Paenibacillus yonginensis TaxID=1462996 RepID=A0A1B1N667_9BACL|nr:helix-turn-helix domain-containing protein [Paenibacillus yonginensis]ANS76887.1 AraC family transcriptional regulator [Paenibacillus yonginensis]